MLKYGDYFSRKTLNYCGISPDASLSIKGEDGYIGKNRHDNIRADMSEIYQSFYTAISGKSTTSPRAELEKLRVEGRIVSAFYDAGVLTGEERDFFKANFPCPVEEADRERISVTEAGLTEGVEKRSEKVAPQIKNPQIRNVRQ